MMLYPFNSQQCLTNQFQLFIKHTVGRHCYWHKLIIIITLLLVVVVVVIIIIIIKCILSLSQAFILFKKPVKEREYI